MAKSGQIVRKWREERSLSGRDIEVLSRAIEVRKHNKQYYIGHATLREIEELNHVPAVYKCETLSIIFKIPLKEVLLAFGIEAHEDEKEPQGSMQVGTPLEDSAPMETEHSFRLNFDIRLNPHETGLLRGNPKDWGIAPREILKGIQPQRFAYALVSVDDDSMVDIIPAGSLIEIDKHQNVIRQWSWRTIRERPIYFVLHEKLYLYGWCQQNQNEILLIPDLASRKRIRRLRTSETRIIGRIVRVWSCLRLPALEFC